MTFTGTTRETINEEVRRDIFDTSSLVEVEITPPPDELLQTILRTGGVIVGGGGSGKTNLGRVLASQIINNPMSNIQIKVTDTCQNWIHKFEPIYYQTINEKTILPDDIYWGEDHILYDLEFYDADDVQDLLEVLITVDFETQRRLKRQGLMNDWIVWVIEEAQNVIGRTSLNGKRGGRWRKILSERRNFNMSFLFIGQRLADISTIAVERCQGYFFGKTTGDNDKQKIRRICGKDAGIHKLVSGLGVGEFIYWDGVQGRQVTNIPLYETHRRPVMWNGNGNGTR